MKNEFLIPECWVDRELLLLLGYSTTIINKANGKADVLTKMEIAYQNKLAIGLVDLDLMKFPKHKNYNSFREIPEHPKAFGMLLKKKNNQSHFIIELEDEFEPWVINLAKQKRKELNSFGDKFFDKTYLHQQNAKKKIDKSVVDFYKKIMEKYPAPFDQIKTWIQKIQNNEI